MTTFSPYPMYPGAAPEYQDGPPPVLVAVADPGPQRRLTVLVRLILLIPHVIVLYLLLLVATVVAFLGWWGALFMGRLPLWAGSVLAGILRWAARVVAYGLLLTDAYPPFSFNDDPAYPVRVALPEPQRLNRAAVFFRVILAFPAYVVGALITYGAGTLMSFIAWIITLVTGRLPAPLHQAFTAVVRYQARNYAYWWMLTPTYPGGLFGDKPGVRTWADQPAAPAPAMPGAGGFDLPDTAGPGVTPPFQATPGYGYPAGPGYGAPAGYGARPLFQPASWALPLTSGAKKLVTTFIVLGVVLFIANIGLQVSRARSVSNLVVASNAIAALNTSHGTLNTEMTAWQNAVQACDQNQTCGTRQDAKAAAYFSTFASQLQAIPLPGSAASAGARVQADATKIAKDFTVLSKTTTLSQYELAVMNVGLTGALANFNTDYSALGKELTSF